LGRKRKSFSNNFSACDPIVGKNKLISA